MSGGTRALGAALVLAMYYVVLFRHPFAPPVADADEQLRADIEQSRALFEARRFSDALAPTERLTKVLPGQAIYHERLALILRELDRPADEAAEWERMMAASPTPVDACPMVAEAKKRAGHTGAALASLEKCASLPPLNPDFLLELGQELLKLDRKAEARRAFERGLDVDRTYPDLYLLLGVRQFDDGEKAAARRSFEEFVRIAPQRRDEAAVWLQRTAGAK
jgi:tetratricopeptide (TPR) repeat protein